MQCCVCSCKLQFIKTFQYLPSDSVSLLFTHSLPYHSLPHSTWYNQHCGHFYQQQHVWLLPAAAASTEFPPTATEFPSTTAAAAAAVVCRFFLSLHELDPVGTAACRPCVCPPGVLPSECPPRQSSTRLLWQEDGW